MATITKTSSKTIPTIIWVCLSAALKDPVSAKACREHFQKLPDEGLGRALCELFRGENDWDLDDEQVAELQQWPQPQLAVLCSAVIQAARSVEASGQPLQCRCIGRAGNPRSISVTLDAEGYFEIVFVGPTLV